MTIEHDTGNLRANYLSRRVEHIDFKSFDARPIVSAMEKMSFSSRDTGRAAQIYGEMLNDPDCTVILTLAGSTSAGGLMDLYTDLMVNNMVDCVVATGASIVDMDFFEGLGFKHYHAESEVDDEVLRQNYIDRIYDTYIDEHELLETDHVISKIADGMQPGAISSRAFIREMGRYLSEHGKKEHSLVRKAYELDVPIFVPAFSDCSAGFGLVKHQVERIKEGKPYLSIDSVADFRELTEVKIKAGSTGLLMIGGGVPKNFAQDTVVCAGILGHDDVAMHKYAVQITVADVRDGACSSSTLKEACSWGKVSKTREQMIFAEATTVMPLIASHAWHSGWSKNRKPKRHAKIFADVK
ncbi:MAG: deoxyhypusine synthase [Hyphomicrobiaceae bacterium]|nr:deoxyhypusine synthase [Hyphomicrobiaceae bacterium]